MQQQIEYSGPSFSGINPENPREVFRALRSVDDAVAEAMALVGEQINNVRYISTSGQTLAETVQRSRWRRGEVRWFSGSWSEVQAIATESKAVFCDGRNNSPQFINDTNDSTSVSRYLKAVDYGASAGDTGGSLTHAHSFTDPSLSGSITVNSHDISHTHGVGSLVVSSDTHFHYIDVVTSTPSASTLVEAGTCTNVATSSHTHQIQDNSCSDAHNHTLSGTTAEGLGEAVAHTVNDTLDVSGGSIGLGTATPLYCTLIPLMKL